MNEPRFTNRGLRLGLAGWAIAMTGIGVGILEDGVPRWLPFALGLAGIGVGVVGAGLHYVDLFKLRQAEADFRRNWVALHGDPTGVTIRPREDSGGTDRMAMTDEPKLLRYASGEEIRSGDRIVFRGDEGQVEFVVVEGDVQQAWYFREYGPSVMLDVEGMGPVLVRYEPLVNPTCGCEPLRLVSRAPAAEA